MAEPQTRCRRCRVVRLANARRGFALGILPFGLIGVLGGAGHRRLQGSSFLRGSSSTRGGVTVEDPLVASLGGGRVLGVGAR